MLVPDGWGDAGPVRPGARARPRASPGCSWTATRSRSTTTSAPLFVLHGPSLFTSTHALWADEFDPPAPPYGTLVAVPTRNAVLAHPIRDARVAGVVEPMLELARSAAEQDAAPLTTRLFWLRDGRLEGVDATPEFAELLERLSNLGTARAYISARDRLGHRSGVRLRPRSPVRGRRVQPLERGRGRRPDAAQRELLRAAARRGLGRAPAAGPRRLGPGHRVLADGPVRQARARLGRDRRGDRRDRARRLPRALERAQPERGGDVGGRRTRPTATACRSGRARPRRRAPRSSTGRASGAPSSATSPRCWPTRTSTRSARSSAASAPATRCGSTSAWPARRRARGTARSAPTASSAGSSPAAASTAPRCTPSTPACCPTPTTSPASPSTAAPRTRSGSRTPCAPPTRSSPAAYVAFEEVVNSFLGRRGAARARLRPARQRPGHAAAALRGGRARRTASTRGSRSPARAATACACSSSARLTSSPSASPCRSPKVG